LVKYAQNVVSYVENGKNAIKLYHSLLKFDVYGRFFGNKKVTDKGQHCMLL